MATDDHRTKAPWDAPRATALTATESRADEADVWMDNGVPTAS